MFLAPFNDTQAQISNENTACYSLQFDGHDAIWCVMNADNSNVLVWESDRLAYSMTGNLDITELIKIADSSEPNVRTRIHRARAMLLNSFAEQAE